MCFAMKRAGISDVSPGHAVLLELLAAGATDDEFISAAQDAVRRGKGFAYALGTVRARRVEAATATKGLHRGPMPAAPASPADRRTRQLETAALMTGAARPAAPQPQETIDVDARVLTR